MTPSEDIFEFIRSQERFRPTSFRERGGTLKIGYGHSGCAQTDLCTVGEAEDWLRQDVAAAGAAVHRLVHAPLNQNQFDALVSFVFNTGVSTLEESTLLDLLNRRNYDGASGFISHWETRDPKVSARRTYEVALFNKEPPRE